MEEQTEHEKKWSLLKDIMIVNDTADYMASHSRGWKSL
jgi:hypothetical protein